MSKCKDKIMPNTYDHRLRGPGHPVRSAIHKPQIGGLVVGWVTTSEYLLLYVYFFIFFINLYLRLDRDMLLGGRKTMVLLKRGIGEGLNTGIRGTHM
jgi:hypothetical protein